MSKTITLSDETVELYSNKTESRLDHKMDISYNEIVRACKKVMVPNPPSELDLVAIVFKLGNGASVASWIEYVLKNGYTP